jgi:flagellar motility protein MotE (MotC chaperone)
MTNVSIGVAARILDRREALLDWLGALRDASEEVTLARGAQFREEALALVDAIDDYLDRENDALDTALRTMTDGDERVAVLEAEHRDEHSLLRGARRRLADPRTSPETVTDVLDDLADGLVGCFAEEDDVVLSLGVVSIGEDEPG